MKSQQIHSIALFWCAVGLALGAAATHYLPVLPIMGIGLIIVALIIGHQVSASMKRQRATTTQSNGRRRRKKNLPKLKGI